MKASATIAVLPSVLDSALYTGDDLEVAAAQSRLSFSATATGAARPLDWVPRAFAEASDLLRHAGDERFRAVTGRESTTGERMTVHFRGSLNILDFCARHIFGNSDYSVSALESADPDLIVDYHRLRYLFLRRKQRLFLPHRINQYLTLAPSWRETLNGLSAKQRKELRRHLRTYRAGVTLCHGPEAIAHFYKCAFLPYAIFRFGDSASVGSRAAFQMKHRNAIVLWLSVDGVPRGANLLYRRGDTLCIEHCGLTPGSEAMPGLFDCIDYFSLLYAQLGGCRELDFGGTRPHLEDGIFRYKAKWSTAIREPRRFLPRIRIGIARETEAVRGFLMRNLFLQTVNGKLTVKVLARDGATDTAVYDRLIGPARPRGVAEWQVVPAESDGYPPAASPFSQPPRSGPPGRRNGVAGYLETF